MSRVASSITGSSGKSILDYSLYPPLVPSYLEFSSSARYSSQVYTSNPYLLFFPFLELASIQQEITGLLALEYQMTRNLEALKSAHSKSKYGRTARGRVIRWMGRIFAVYCVFRSISVKTFLCFTLCLFPYFYLFSAYSIFSVHSTRVQTQARALTPI